MARGRREVEFRPSYTDTVERVERQGALFDSMFKNVKLFKPKVGVNAIRILPPTWEKPKHYGLYVKVHNNVGPKNRRYLCLKENHASPYDSCPLCDQLYRLGAKALDEDKRVLRTSDVVAYYLLDKDAEKEGLQMWATSANNDTEIAVQCLNRRSKSILDITDPDNGYDLEFTRAGTTFNTTRYRGFHIVHEPSPISDNGKLMDTILDEIFDRPLSDTLNFYSQKHIEEVFYGRAKDDDDRPTRRARDEEDEEEERPVRRNRREVVEEEEAPRRPARAAREAEEEEEAPAPRRASRPTREPVEEEEEAPPRRARTRTERELDDEIPSRGERRTEEKSRAVEEDEEEAPVPTRRARARMTEDEEEAPRARRARPNGAAEDDEEQPDTRSRDRMRERLDRSAE